ncbi:MAG: phosphoribosylformylglycinamidine cyclo-ligase, partial [Acidimicrobiales bacterium]|nr:phosphoribosylformylglycinamidine cyclo-ligase [Acidimicrobiales bacterium]
EPLFFLDYIAVGKLDPDHIEQLVEGVAEGCRQAGCALIGGEMAEHPGAMEPGEFDLVGFAVGVAERDQLITGEHVRPGDVLIGLPSPGLRSNGYSLARRVLLDRAELPLDGPAFEGAHHTLATELLTPSVIYAPAVLALERVVDVRAVVHVTGGGLAGNLVRVLPKGLDATVDPRSWEEPRIFGEIRRLGEIDDDEMRKVFNLGVGMVIAVPADDAFRAIDVLRTNGHRAVEIGTVAKGSGEVHFA